jgi:DNA repair exonuclease SbcCD ATPase subunit
MGVAKEQQRRLENYKMLPDSCVTCGQKVPHEHKDGMLHKEQSNLNDTVKKAQHLREQEAQAQSSLNLAVEGANTAQQQWSKTQQQAYEQMKSFKDAQGKLTTAEWELKACQQTLAQAAAQYNAALHEQNPHAARAIEWATVLWPKADAAARQAALSAQILEKRVAVLTYWVTGLGTKGLKSYVLDGKVAEMTEEANRWVRFLTGGTIWVEFKTQREVGKGKTKKAVEDLSLYVHRAFPDGTVVRRNYRSWSGGEKSKVALGIDFGLARLVAKRASRAYDLLILDEVFQKDLDYSGKEAVAEMLVALSKEKSSIFVVDHDAGFQHLFSGRMVVRKHQRRSRVVEGIYYGVEPKGSQDSSKESDFLSTHTAFPG